MSAFTQNVVIEHDDNTRSGELCTADIPVQVESDFSTGDGGGKGFPIMTALDMPDQCGDCGHAFDADEAQTIKQYAERDAGVEADGREEYAREMRHFRGNMEDV